MCRADLDAYTSFRNRFCYRAFYNFTPHGIRTLNSMGDANEKNARTHAHARIHTYTHAYIHTRAHTHTSYIFTSIAMKKINRKMVIASLKYIYDNRTNL